MNKYQIIVSLKGPGGDVVTRLLQPETQEPMILEAACLTAALSDILQSIHDAFDRETENVVKLPLELVQLTITKVN